jgi:putative flippase GtrA
MGKIRHELWTFAKAEMSASAASCVDFGLAISLTYLGLLTYGYANIIGVVCGGLTNFMLNSRYVFSQTGRGKKALAERYLVVWIGSMLLNGGGTNLLTWLAGGKSYFVIVKCLVALAVAFGFNYPLQRGWVFRQKIIKAENDLTSKQK